MPEPFSPPPRWVYHFQYWIVAFWILLGLLLFPGGGEGAVLGLLSFLFAILGIILAIGMSRNDPHAFEITRIQHGFIAVVGSLISIPVMLFGFFALFSPEGPDGGPGFADTSTKGIGLMLIFLSSPVLAIAVASWKCASLLQPKQKKSPAHVPDHPFGE